MMREAAAASSRSLLARSAASSPSSGSSPASMAARRLSRSGSGRGDGGRRKLHQTGPALDGLLAQCQWVAPLGGLGPDTCRTCMNSLAPYNAAWSCSQYCGAWPTAINSVEQARQVRAVHGGRLHERHELLTCGRLTWTADLDLGLMGG